jgi:hypothetical protein
LSRTMNAIDSSPFIISLYALAISHSEMLTACRRTKHIPQHGAVGRSTCVCRTCKGYRSHIHNTRYFYRPFQLRKKRARGAHSALVHIQGRRVLTKEMSEHLTKPDLKPDQLGPRVWLLQRRGPSFSNITVKSEHGRGIWG